MTHAWGGKRIGGRRRAHRHSVSGRGEIMSGPVAGKGRRVEKKLISGSISTSKGLRKDPKVVGNHGGKGPLEKKNSPSASKKEHAKAERKDKLEKEKSSYARSRLRRKKSRRRGRNKRRTQKSVAQCLKKGEK